MPRVSIIVPMYNVEDRLADCLDSLCGQTLADIEVVCVDDGSPDGSAAIAQAYAARDERVRVVRQENRGLSGARNAGMRVACGEIVMFCDGDDMFEANACERVCEVFDEGAPETVVFGAACVPEEAASPHVVELLSPRDAVYDTFDTALLFREHAVPYVWRVACSRALLEREGLRFDEELPFAEDMAFCFALYPRSRKTALISDKLYRYRVEGPSLTRAYNEPSARSAKAVQYIRVLGSILRTWDAYGLTMRDPGAFLTWMMDWTLFTFARLPHEEQGARFAELDSLFERSFGSGYAEMPGGAAMRSIMRRIRLGRGIGGASGMISLARFYIERRGIAACVRKAMGR